MTGFSIKLEVPLPGALQRRQEGVDGKGWWKPAVLP